MAKYLHYEFNMMLVLRINVVLIKISKVKLTWILVTVQVAVELEDMIVRKLDWDLKIKFILKITALLVKVSNMNLVWYFVAV